MSSTSLKEKAINGTIWTIFGYGTSQVLRFGSNLILTRLLAPDLFGLMALVQIFIRGLSLFSDIGIKPSIIRSPHGEEPIFLNTAWSIQVVRGFGLWIACLIITIPVANYYEEQRLLWLIPIVGFTTIISGFNSTILASLNRRMEFRKIAIFELGVQIISLAILIGWAWLYPSIWALVGGNLVSVSLIVLFSHKINLEKPNRFAWDKKAIQEIVSFGKWIFLSTAMTFLASEADRILLGKFFSLEMLGIYIVAFTFADIPRQVSQKISSKVIFPAISQLIDLPRKTLKQKIVAKRWKLIMLLSLMVAVLACFGDLVILALYDDRYQQASWILPILAIGLWPLLLSTTMDRFLVAAAKPSYLALGNFFKFIYMIVGIPLGFLKMGILGVIIVIALNDFPYYVAINYGLCKEKLNFLWQDFQATFFLIGTIIAISFIRANMGLGFAIDGIL